MLLKLLFCILQSIIVLLLVSLVQGIPRTISVQTSHFIYQNNGSYVDFYDFYHDKQICALSANTAKELRMIATISMVLFKLVPWCLICILNVVITFKVKQHDQWEQNNHLNRQVTSQLMLPSICL